MKSAVCETSSQEIKYTTCRLGTDAKLRQSVPRVVVVNVAADLKQGRNVASACVCQSERSGAEVSSNNTHRYHGDNVQEWAIPVVWPHVVDGLLGLDKNTI